MIDLFLYFLVAINLLGFFSIGYDKRLAVLKRKRISERNLLTIVALGGVFGSGIGMLFFRHKTVKKSYLLKFFGICILLILIVFFLLRNRNYF